MLIVYLWKSSVDTFSQ